MLSPARFSAIAFLAGLWLASGIPTHADQPASPLPSPSPSAASSPAALPGPGEVTNPFPSPSPTTVPPGGNGYAAAGFAFGSSSGGQIAPRPGTTSTPIPFPASGTSGFWLDLTGRLGPAYLAALLYDNHALHGGDNALVSYAQGRVLFQPSASRAAFGLGLVSAQRSTSSSNMNGFGLGAALLPATRSGVTEYGSLFFYPHLQISGKSASLTAIDAGLMFVPARRGGLFFRIGGSVRAGAPANTSPTSVSSLLLGLGSSF